MSKCAKTKKMKKNQYEFIESPWDYKFLYDADVMELIRHCNGKDGVEEHMT